MTIYVLLEDSGGEVVWLAEGEGDPPRTLQAKNARRFSSRIKALKALAEARKFRPFRRGRLVYDRETTSPNQGIDARGDE